MICQRLPVSSSTAFAFAQRLQSCDFPYLCKELCCGRPRLVISGGRDFPPGLAAVEVFAHFKQLVDITAA